MNKEEILKEAWELGMKQNPYEIENAYDFVESLAISSFMEIGTDQGGTFLTWARLSQKWTELDHEDGLKISVDMPHGKWGVNTFDIEKRDEKLRSLGNVQIVHGDSHSENIHVHVKNMIGDKKLDFLFIDGDHSYLGVKLDFYMYKEFVKKGGWIGFHDIKESQTHREGECFVDIFWNELQYNKVWFTADTDWGGIGFVQI